MDESFEERREIFQNKFSINIKDVDKTDYVFDPNSAYLAIKQEQLQKFAETIKGTPHQDLIAYKDPKVQELVNYILSAIIMENEKINNNPFPIQIYSRYKADTSFSDKLDRWDNREEKQGVQMPDYFAIRIVPEREPAVFLTNGDPVLQEMIDKREENRKFIAERYKELSENPNMTFNEYVEKCVLILNRLSDIFPVEAETRKEHYAGIIDKLKNSVQEYDNAVENSNEAMHYEEIADISEVDITSLLSELALHNPNEVTLYKLKKDILNTFNKSELLKSLGITVEKEDKSRTKSKKSPIGYRSEFIGLNLNIRTDDGDTIVLPIECQLQAIEQYRDSKTGFSAHVKLPGKLPKLKTIPGTGESQKYTDVSGKTSEYKEYLSYLMHISPTSSITKTTGNEFENGRTVTTTYDLYESFRLISRVPSNSATYRATARYLKTLYEKRSELIPTGDTLLPKYLEYNDIPNPITNYDEYNQFFSELRSSLKDTLKVLENVESIDQSESLNNEEQDLSEHSDHDEH